MDIRKFSLFIIVIGLCLLVLGGNQWLSIENDAKLLDNYRQSMRDAEIDRVNNLQAGMERMRGREKLVNEIVSDITLLMNGYSKQVRKNHSLSYLLIIKF